MGVFFFVTAVLVKLKQADNLKREEKGAKKGKKNSKKDFSLLLKMTRVYKEPRVSGDPAASVYPVPKRHKGNLMVR